MAIYPNYPGAYQPMYYQQPQQPQQQATGIIWVQGEAGAKAYMVAPNTTVQLYDTERQSIYLKSADASGMPSMRILDYTIRDQAQVQGPTVQPGYATKADVEALQKELAELRTQIGGAGHE